MSNKLAYYSIAHLLPLFHQPWWLDAVCEGEWDVAMHKENEVIVAVWPYQIEKKWGFKIIRNPLLTAYLGPVFLGNETDDLLLKLWNQLPKATMLQWSCFPEFNKEELFGSKKIEYKKKRTYFIDLSDTEEVLWAKIFPKRKNDIRKAQQDLEVRQCKIDMPLFTKWHQRSFNDKGKSYPFTVAFFDKIVNITNEKNSSFSLSAFDQQENCIAQIWLGFDKQKMYYLLSATAAETHRGAVALLIWNAIIEAKIMGLKIFDFEGSMDEGIAKFFQRFGGEEKSYLDFTITHSPLWKLKQKILG